MEYAILFSSLLLAATQLLSQAASNSPYSDQTFDPAANSAWYTDPLTVGGIILVVVILILLIRSRRK